MSTTLGKTNEFGGSLRPSGGWGISILAFLLVFSSCNNDSLNRRKSTAKRITVLKNRLLSNPEDQEALDEIGVFLNDDYRFGRVYACTVICEVGPSAKELIPDLLIALDGGDPFVEPEAAKAIGSMGIDAESAIPSLERKVGDESNGAAMYAAEALGKIGLEKQSTIDALQNGAKSEFEMLANYCNEALRLIENSPKLGR